MAPMSTDATAARRHDEAHDDARPLLVVLSETPRIHDVVRERLGAALLDAVRLVCLDVNDFNAGTGDARRVVREARILLGDPGLVGPRMKEFISLEWMHSAWTGIDMMLPPVRTDYRLTRLTELGPSMAEYVLGVIFSLERDFERMAAQQRRAEWKKVFYRHFADVTVGIMGITGKIGGCVARALTFMGCRVIGYASTPRDAYCYASSDEEADRVRRTGGFPTVKGTLAPITTRVYGGAAEMPAFLAQVDYIVSVLPSTPATRGILSGDALMPASARRPVLINTGRGDLIDEESVIRALDSGWIRHAVLDVFWEEPLPAGSPLWARKDVTISPHSSAISYPEHVVTCFRENLERFLRNEPLKDLVDFEKGY